MSSQPVSVGVKELKNQVIGNEIKKEQVLSSGMLPSLCKALSANDTELLVDLIPLLTSLAFNRRLVCGELIQKYAMHRRLASLLATSTSVNLLACVLRSLKSLFRSRRHAAELAMALIEGGCVPVLVRLLSAQTEAIRDLAACVLASCCAVAATPCCSAEPSLVAALLRVLRPVVDREASSSSSLPSPRCQSQALVALAALVDDDAVRCTAVLSSTAVVELLRSFVEASDSALRLAAASLIVSLDCAVRVAAPLRLGGFAPADFTRALAFLRQPIRRCIQLCLRFINQQPQPQPPVIEDSCRLLARLLCASSEFHHDLTDALTSLWPMFHSGLRSPTHEHALTVLTALAARSHSCRRALLQPQPQSQLQSTSSAIAAAAAAAARPQTSFLPLLVTALSARSSSQTVRVAACQCLSAICRSPSLTPRLADSTLLPSLVGLLSQSASPDVHCRALSVLAHLLLEPTQRPIAIEQTALARIAPLFRSTNGDVRLLATWAAKNLAFHAKAEQQRAMLSQLGFDSFAVVLNDADARVRAQAVMLVRNLCTPLNYPSPFVFHEHATQLFSLLLRIVDAAVADGDRPSSPAPSTAALLASAPSPSSSGADPYTLPVVHTQSFELIAHCLVVFAQACMASDALRDIVASNDRLLPALLKLLSHAELGVRSAAAWCVTSIAAPPQKQQIKQEKEGKEAARSTSTAASPSQPTTSAATASATAATAVSAAIPLFDRLKTADFTAALHVLMDDSDWCLRALGERTLRHLGISTVQFRSRKQRLASKPSKASAGGSDSQVQVPTTTKSDALTDTAMEVDEKNTDKDSEDGKADLIDGEERPFGPARPRGAEAKSSSAVTVAMDTEDDKNTSTSPSSTSSASSAAHAHAHARRRSRTRGLPLLPGSASASASASGSASSSASKSEPSQRRTSAKRDLSPDRAAAAPVRNPARTTSMAAVAALLCSRVYPQQLACLLPNPFGEEIDSDPTPIAAADADATDSDDDMEELDRPKRVVVDRSSRGRRGSNTGGGGTERKATGSSGSGSGERESKRRRTGERESRQEREASRERERESSSDDTTSSDSDNDAKAAASQPQPQPRSQPHSQAQQHSQSQTEQKAAQQLQPQQQRARALAAPALAGERNQSHEDQSQSGSSEGEGLENAMLQAAAARLRARNRVRALFGLSQLAARRQLILRVSEAERDDRERDAAEASAGESKEAKESKSVPAVVPAPHSQAQAPPSASAVSALASGSSPSARIVAARSLHSAPVDPVGIAPLVRGGLVSLLRMVSASHASAMAQSQSQSESAMDDSDDEELHLGLSAADIDAVLAETEEVKSTQPLPLSGPPPVPTVRVSSLLQRSADFAAACPRSVHVSRQQQQLQQRGTASSGSQSSAPLQMSTAAAASRNSNANANAALSAGRSSSSLSAALASASAARMTRL